MAGRNASRRRHHTRPLDNWHLLQRLQTNCLSVVDGEEAGLVVCRAASARGEKGELLFVALLLLLSVFSFSFFLFSFACSPSWRPLPPLERARRQGAAIVFSGDDALVPNGAHLLFTGGLGGLSDVSLRSLEEGRRYAALDLIGAHAPRLLRKRIRSLRWANSCCCQLGLRLCEDANAPWGSR